MASQEPLQHAFASEISDADVKLGGEGVGVAEPFDLNKQDGDGLTPIIQAAFDGDFEEVQRLYKLGADINRVDHRGLNAGWWAARNHRWNIVHYLLERGLTELSATPLESTVSGATILWFAARDGQWTMVEQLITKYGVRELDATVQEGEHEHSTALDFACAAAKLSIVKLLVQKGAPVNFRGRFASVLMRAFNSPEIFRYLITEANVIIDDPKTLNSTQVVRFGQDKCCAEQLMAIESARNLFFTIRNNNLTMGLLKMLLTKGAHFNQRSHEKINTPLHMAAERRAARAAVCLLEHMKKHYSWNRQQYHLCALNENNETPLDLALKRNAAEVKQENELKRFMNVIFSSGNESIKTLVSKCNDATENSMSEIGCLYMNAVQDCINRHVFEFKQQLGLFKMEHLPFDLAFEILQTRGAPQFATTPRGRRFVKLAYEHAYNSVQIQKAVDKRGFGAEEKMNMDRQSGLDKAAVAIAKGLDIKELHEEENTPPKENIKPKPGLNQGSFHAANESHVANESDVKKAGDKSRPNAGDKSQTKTGERTPPNGKNPPPALKLSANADQRLPANTVRQGLANAAAHLVDSLNARSLNRYR